MIEFSRVAVNKEAGLLENVNLMPSLIKEFQQYESVFRHDYMPPVRDYNEWLDAVIETVNAHYPWFFAVMVDDAFHGAIWAENWQDVNEQGYSVEINGFSKRKAESSHNYHILKKFCDKIFSESTVYVIRCIVQPNNLAALRLLKKCGFENPCPVFAWKVMGHKEIVGTMMSVTRPRFEEISHGL